jgi:uncharacterized membrane protein YvbJ
MFCFECGRKIEKDEKLCVNCGQPVENYSTSGDEAESDYYIAGTQVEVIRSKNLNKDVRKAAAIMAAVVIIVVIAGFFIRDFMSVNSSPEKVVRALMKSIYSEDVDGFIRTVAGDQYGFDKTRLKDVLKRENESLKKGFDEDQWLKVFKVKAVRSVSEDTFYRAMGGRDKDLAKLYKDKVQYFRYVNIELGEHEVEIPVIKTKKGGKYYVSRGFASVIINEYIEDVDEEEDDLMQYLRRW